MEEPPKTSKIIFTTAHRRANSEEKGPEVSKKEKNSDALKKEKNSEPSKKDKASKSKTSKPSNNKKPEDSNEEKGENVKSVKKKQPKNKKPPSNKNNEEIIEKIVEKVDGMKLNNNSSLNIEAAPFTPSLSSASSLESTTTPIVDKKVKVRRPVSRPSPKIKESEDLRSVEVKQLKIRFSPTGFMMSKNVSDDSIKLQCVMPITDPDFAFDLESVRIEIKLPRGYPGTKETPIRPEFSIMNSDLPATIVTRIERNLKWGLGSLQGGVLVCRPMLRYLEDNLEKWLVDDVREAAFKFVKPSEIKVTEKSSSDSEDLESEAEDEDEDEEFNFNAKKDSNTNNTYNNSNTSRISKGDWIAPAPVTDQSCVGGSSYTLKLIFSCIRGIDLLTSQRLTFLASCDRCRFNFPVEELRPFVDRIEHCPKCTNQTKFHYKAQLVTPAANFEVEDGEEFEAFLGSIRFLRAKPVDLLPSLYQCACNRCYGNEDDVGGGIEDASMSSCKIEKVKIGEAIAYGCFRCHQKIRFQIDRIEWAASDSFNKPAASPSASKAKSAANKNGPTLTVGTPLPLNGACEHYKKSFRWYRFPCCGQAFPCDECHAKDPVAKDHPVEWANRFICGFCSREQSISIKECPECGRDTSASARRHTTFWEGGKGTRNQILMSRKDSKKYKDYSSKSKSSGGSNQKK